MKQFTYSLLLIIATTNIILAQGVKVNFETGIGTYNMYSLKHYNEFIIKNLPFEATLVSNFPSYYFYRPSVQLQFVNGNIGALCGFHSTGSRISSKDYSGEYLLDLKTKAFSPGIFTQMELFDSFVSMWLQGIFGITFSELNLNEYLKLNGEVILNEKLSLSSHNFYFEPGIVLQIPVKNFSISAVFGGQIMFNREILFGSGQRNFIWNPLYDEAAIPGWSGYRISIMLSWIKYDKNLL